VKGNCHTQPAVLMTKTGFTNEEFVHMHVFYGVWKVSRCIEEI
jgi:hypothetical protein